MQEQKSLFFTDRYIVHPDPVYLRAAVFDRAALVVLDFRQRRLFFSDSTGGLRLTLTI